MLEGEAEADVRRSTGVGVDDLEGGGRGEASGVGSRVIVGVEERLGEKEGVAEKEGSGVGSTTCDEEAEGEKVGVAKKEGSGVMIGVEEKLAEPLGEREGVEDIEALLLGVAERGITLDFEGKADCFGGKGEGVIETRRANLLGTISGESGSESEALVSVSEREVREANVIKTLSAPWL